MDPPSNSCITISCEEIHQCIDEIFGMTPEEASNYKLLFFNDEETILKRNYVPVHQGVIDFACQRADTLAECLGGFSPDEILTTLTELDLDSADDEFFCPLFVLATIYDNLNLANAIQQPQSIANVEEEPEWIEEPVSPLETATIVTEMDSFVSDYHFLQLDLVQDALQEGFLRNRMRGFSSEELCMEVLGQMDGGDELAMKHIFDCYWQTRGDVLEIDRGLPLLTFLDFQRLWAMSFGFFMLMSLETEELDRLFPRGCFVWFSKAIFDSNNNERSNIWSTILPSSQFTPEPHDAPADHPFAWFQMFRGTTNPSRLKRGCPAVAFQPGGTNRDLILSTHCDETFFNTIMPGFIRNVEQTHQQPEEDWTMPINKVDMLQALMRTSSSFTIGFYVVKVERMYRAYISFGGFRFRVRVVSDLVEILRKLSFMLVVCWDDVTQNVLGGSSFVGSYNYWLFENEHGLECARLIFMNENLFTEAQALLIAHELYFREGERQDFLDVFGEQPEHILEDEELEDMKRRLVARSSVSDDIQGVY